jgi:formylglycine-generating enzyme required for sulfatase activity
MKIQANGQYAGICTESTMTALHTQRQAIRQRTGAQVVGSSYGDSFAVTVVLISVIASAVVLTFASCGVKEISAEPRDCGYPVVATLPESVPAAPKILEGFVLIPAGSFQMGDQSNPPVGDDDELPVHTVEVDAFYMAKYEVTKGLWDKVRKWGVAHGYADLTPQEYAGWASASGKADNHPVYEVTWWEVIEWCNARSEMDGLAPCYTVNGVVMKSGMTVPAVNWSASGYRLPTEAEWEKAARGGLVGQNFPWGNKIIYSKGNFNPHGEKADQTGATDRHPSYVTDDVPYTSPVGSFSPNGYGLYDMAGNVSEWCWDWWVGYSKGLQTNTNNPASGWKRGFRGGSWDDVAAKNRVAYRYMTDPDCSQIHIGFRVARSK